MSTTTGDFGDVPQDIRRINMPFKELMNDTVSLLKSDERKFENIKASVQRDKIFIDDGSIPVEEGDTYVRKLPNGIVERYTVLDAGYYEGIAGIKTHYQSVVRKETKIEPKTQPTHIVYNLIGPNARVNIQSVDSSTNLVEIEPSELFEKLRAVIKHSIKDDNVSAQLSEKVDELHQTQGTKAFVTKYQEFMALAANHVTILAPFIPALSQMLS